MRGFLKRHKILTPVLCVLLVVFILVAAAGYWRLSTILIPSGTYSYENIFTQPQDFRCDTVFIGTVLEVEGDEARSKKAFGIPVSVAKVRVDRVLKGDAAAELNVPFEGGVLPIESYIRAAYPSEEENRKSTCGNTGPSAEYMLEHLRELKPFKKRAAYFSPLYRRMKKGCQFLFLFFPNVATMENDIPNPIGDYWAWQIKGQTVYRPDGKPWGGLEEMLAVIQPEKDEPPN